MSSNKDMPKFSKHIVPSHGVLGGLIVESYRLVQKHVGTDGKLCTVMSTCLNTDNSTIALSCYVVFSTSMRIKQKKGILKVPREETLVIINALRKQMLERFPELNEFLEA
jgi:hypothetical protein